MSEALETVAIVIGVICVVVGVVGLVGALFLAGADLDRLMSYRRHYRRGP